MPRRIGGLAWMTAAAATLAATALGVLAQNQTADQPQQPTFRTEANYVRVDVFPTANGAPVADLRPEDFQILEDGVPQRIEQFEHVLIRGNLPQETRREPGTVAESRAMLREARARVFVLFLDTLHVEQGASRAIRGPLVDMINRLIGPDDLIAVMTPQMSPSEVTFARKTVILERFLDRAWWGERDALIPSDPIEDRFRFCYPPARGSGRQTSEIAQEMIDRRREKMTLASLENLVVFLRGAREERKAIIAITDGWLLFRPNPTLVRPVDDRPPPLPPVTVDPRNGRLTTKDPTNAATALADCERERSSLSLLDDNVHFRSVLDEANRANASFYPVDPRGLTAFDAPIGPDPPPPPAIDRAQGSQRTFSLRTLAADTDGTAVVSTNNISPALQRIVTDLSSYYLLGYYSTNAKLDGKFRSISVRVRRSGVQVRARRGYLAARASDLIARPASAPPAPSTASAAATGIGVEAVIGSLARFARDAPLRVHAASGWNSGDAPVVWVVGEVSANEPWTGGEATVTLLRGGTLVSSARANVPSGSRSFRVALTSSALQPGEYQVRVRARNESGSGGALDEIMPLTLASSPDATGALLLRRGPSTANKSIATADLRFRRNERLGLEIPARAPGPPSVRLLDRAGRALAVPMNVAARDDGDGSKWHAGELVLAPLAPGDYVIEVATGSSGDQTHTLVPFRVVP